MKSEMRMFAEKHCILWQKIKSKATEDYNAITRGTNKHPGLGSTTVFSKAIKNER